MKEVNQYIIDDVKDNKERSIISASASISNANNYVNQLNMSILEKEGFVEKYDEVKERIIKLLDKMKEDIEKQLKNQ